MMNDDDLPGHRHGEEFDDVDADLLLLAVDPIEPDPQVRAALLTSIAAPSWSAPFVRRVAELCDLTREAATALLASIDDAGRWLIGPAAGVEAFHIDAGPALEGAIVGFIRIAPGAVFPAHAHVGAEDVLVLQGGFVAGGVEVKAGSELPMAPGSKHELRALPEGCLYLGVARGGMDFGDGVVGPDDPRV